MSTVRKSRPVPARPPSPSSSPAPTHLPKPVQAEIRSLARSKKAQVTQAADGSVTTSKSTQRRGTHVSQQVTTAPGKGLAKTLTYQKQTTKEGWQNESTFTQSTDLVGRTSTDSRKQTDTTKGATARTMVTTRATDVYGVTRYGSERTLVTTTPKGSRTVVDTRTSDDRGNAFKAKDTTTVTQQGPSTLTTNQKSNRGAQLETQSVAAFENQTFTFGGGADWKKGAAFSRSVLHERAVDASAVVKKADAVASRADQVLELLGLDARQWSSQVAPELLTTRTLAQGSQGSVETRVGVTGGQSAGFDGTTATAQFDRKALAGVFANAGAQVSGPNGEASYEASAKAEATAAVAARAQANTNGVTATVDARAGVAVEAEISGRVATNPVTIAGVDVNASVQGHAKVAAQAVAEATGTVTVSRNPPTAIVSGSAGVSAVVKAEADVLFQAGPLSVTASAYASAGAEARADGVVGYSDGKLKIGGSAGVAVGVGGGGSATVEVDVKQVVTLAKTAATDAIKNAADVNGDGRVDARDGVALVTSTAWVARWLKP